jgi:pimeloyl-ACP methyl ester carboxylesterase
MTRFGPLDAEVTRPETDKFTAPLVLVHGLWDRATVWRRFAGYLAHRGWHCIALGRRGAVSDVATHVSDLRAAISALDAPPVIVGHDLGATWALHCADLARAVVALAPLMAPPLAPPSPALRNAGTWLARVRGAPLRAPRGAWRSAYPNRDLVEPAGLVAQLLSGVAPPPAPPNTIPCTVMAMDGDEVTATNDAQALAQHVGAQFQILHGAHSIDSPTWESTVASVHRWIIKQLGVDLLALYEESIQPE